MSRIPEERRLREIYGEEVQTAVSRYLHLKEGFEKRFGEAELSYFTAPGRTEIIGNHVDHNGGKILCASITMDTICAAEKTDDGKITVVSEGFPEVAIQVERAGETPHRKGTLSLLAGIVEGIKAAGFQAGGFRAYVTSNVIPSAGVSSSASFEMLICTVLNHFYNGEKMQAADYARAGQYAENHFWDKASGLMDQMACAFGGTILLDFREGVQVEKVDFSFDDLDSDLIIVNTGKGHANLSEEYSSIPKEMFALAKRFGKERLCEVSEEDFLQRLTTIRQEIQNDRAILRALHFFEETRRVTEAGDALRAGTPEKLLPLITEGGNSSWKWLQNGSVSRETKEQSIPLALALTEIFCKRKGDGVCRIHGGGFAGVIMAVIPKRDTAEYVDFMTPYFGKENLHIMNIRQTGAVFVGA